VVRTEISSFSVSHATLGSVTVGPVESRVTFALRRDVLRPQRSIEEMDTIDSGAPGSLVVAARTEAGTIVSTGAVMPEPLPSVMSLVVPHGPSWRLRGMATSADARGGGLGAAVLERLLAHVADRGGRVVWCAARIPAVTFYRRAGFQTAGDSWVDPEIGPHIHMWMVVPTSAGVRK
jgi:GNAT superfamily N-acetyltransferase